MCHVPLTGQRPKSSNQRFIGFLSFFLSFTSVMSGRGCGFNSILFQDPHNHYWLVECHWEMRIELMGVDLVCLMSS